MFLDVVAVAAAIDHVLHVGDEEIERRGVEERLGAVVGVRERGLRAGDEIAAFEDAIAASGMSGLPLQLQALQLQAQLVALVERLAQAVAAGG